ncbi:NAD(P)-dependent alcohol dehydrogenase [Georgenia sp. SUBG003]|uniref:NAD(P)-dependent alcohol dehydrogenase n=1 Tax=Georgenia sp. SUBG003 TaxID=1497974 RepID=UPI0004DA1931|nr:alcohol dehydrogenase [Georgenia sp. SUBG003]
MPTTINAYGTPQAGQPLGPVEIERRDVGPHDVKLDILYCGICHSDIHFAGGDFGPLPVSPLVPGHEIVGIVTEVGSEVTRHQIGDRVGIGCMVNSCRECENCRRGEEQYCLNGHTLVFGNEDRDGSFTQGGYSRMIVANEDFVVRVPESLDAAAAAPLLCAGITVYAPLKRWGAGPGKRVAVVGLGGLGHLGVKIAKAMGAEVTVLSRSESKRQDALDLGADAYLATGDESTFSTLANTFDIVLNTVSAPIDVNAYLGLLRLRGTLASVGVTTETLPLNVFSVLTNERTLAGSQFGGIRETQEMLDFCAEHGVTADVELISADRINEAFDRVLRSDVRYRFVIDAATLE